MPRQARIDAPGALHHIIVRGIEKKAIFRDQTDKDRFVGRLGKILTDTATPCYAWALMTNHIHILLITGAMPIAALMRRLLTGYAQDFNRRHKRHGQLFQNRYKSILCEKDPYLLELVRYIHLNPLRAGLVKNMDELTTYPYSGHRVLMGAGEYCWQDSLGVLGLFGETVKAGRKKYSAYMAEGIQKGRRPELVGGGLIRSSGGWVALKKHRREGIRIKGDERILGGSNFVESVLKQADEELQAKARIESLGLDINELLSRIAAYYGVDVDELRSGSRQRSIAMARSAACYLAVRKMQLSCTAVAAEFRISASAVSNAATRGKQILQNTAGIEESVMKLF